MNQTIPLQKLQQILDESTNSGSECGLQLAIYVGGKLEANLYSGYADEKRTRKVTADTLFPIYSSGKGIMATAFHMLMQEFQVSYDEKVSTFWKTFTGSGKEEIEIWQILSHRTGLHMLPNVPDTSEQLADWDFMVKKMEAAIPKFQPGTKCGYQGITFAWLLGELAFRISNVPFKEYIQTRIINPLGLEKAFYFGLTDEAEKITAEIDRTDYKGKPDWTSCFINQPVIRRGFIPSANGFATAKAVATIYNAILHGSDTLPPLLTPQRLEQATLLHRQADDPIIPDVTWDKFGLGYAMPKWETIQDDIFGHGGAAGAEALFCKSRDMALCFVKNRTLLSHPLHPVRDRISDALGLPHRIW